MPYVTSEGYVYVDEGCNLHSPCLTCPLPRCQFDEWPRRPGPKPKLVVEKPDNTARDAAMRERRKAGVPIGDIAKEFGVTKVRVYQVTAT